MAIPQASGFVIDTTTILSLLSTLAILVAAYLVSLSALPRESAAKLRFLFIWHAFDALIHFILEGSYLWNCFFSYLDLTNGGGDILPSDRVSEYLPPDVFFLGRPDRVYGAEYGTTPFSALWREYAKADRRWGGSDLTVISLELLTVFGAGPLACWICWNLSKSGEEGAKGWGRAWFWMVVLATGELYGGWMTFAPEWLSGSPNLDTSNFMYLWVYLFFFNTLWVWIPLWILYEAYKHITTALNQQQAQTEIKKNA